jgi:deoxyribonuclease V
VDATLKCRNLHRWDVTTAEAREIQERLRGMVVETWDHRQVRTVAGADVGFPDRRTALAAVVVLTFPGLEVVETRLARRRCAFPYVPGLLAFREIPGLLAALKMVKTDFDLLMCDAQGLAHPRGMGLATHVGILLDRPVVGCAKSLLCGRFGRVAVKRGSLSRIKDDTGIAIGAALRTRDGVQPVYVSVGNRVDLATAIDLVLACSVKYRIPVPLRLAHRLSVGQEVAIGTRAARE